MYIVLYNPLSKNNKSTKVVNKLLRYMEEKEYKYMSKSVLHIEDISEFFDSLNKDDKLVLVGGDGTFSQFLHSMAKNNIKQEVFFYPAGTGNDFIRTLHLNKKIKTFENILLQKKEKIDLPHVIGTNVNRNFINGCGFGIDGVVVQKSNQSKVKNTLSYLLNAVTTIFSYKRTNVHVTIDDKEYFFKKTWIVAIQNGKYFGGGMKIAPKAEINDGLLDICIVHKINPLLFLLVFPTVFFGFHIKLKKLGVFYTRGKKISIMFDESRIGQIDGDILDEEKSVFINV